MSVEIVDGGIHDEYDGWLMSELNGTYAAVFLDSERHNGSPGKAGP